MNTTNSHTSGPWEIELPENIKGFDVPERKTSDIVGKDGRIAGVVTFNSGELPERRANAKLIALAPVMFDEIDRVVAAMRDELTKADPQSGITVAECMDAQDADGFRITVTLAQANRLALILEAVRS